MTDVAHPGVAKEIPSVPVGSLTEDENGEVTSFELEQTLVPHAPNIEFSINPVNTEWSRKLKGADENDILSVTFDEGNSVTDLGVIEVP